MSGNTDYNSYAEWKNWTWKSCNDVPNWLRRYFKGEISRLKLPPNAKILEVGFGDGSFMEWARANGYEVDGIEIIEEQVTRANKEGFRAALLNIGDPLTDETLKPFNTATYDAIVALDVIEHLSEVQFKHFLSFATKVLQPGGKILVRFPNGGSPFGLRLQNGDGTHRMALTESRLHQLLTGSAFKLVSCNNAYRVTGDGKLRILQKFAGYTRSLIEILLGLAYFNRRVPLDPALTSIFELEVKKVVDE